MADPAVGADLPDPLPRRAHDQDPRRAGDPQLRLLPRDRRQPRRATATCSACWFQRTEGAKFWLQVLTELKTRGVQDVLVCCVDGLTGFPEAIEAVYPQAWVQTCLVHLVRSSLRFVPYKDKKKVAADLQEDLHRRRPRPRRIRARALRRDLGRQVPDDLRQLDRALGTDRPVPGLPADLRRAVYTTNTIEALEPPDPQDHQDPRQLPRRGLSPQAALPRHHPRPAEWRHTYNWNTALTAFRIHFGDRLPDTA